MADNYNRLLVVDDERGIVDYVSAVARQQGYAVAGANTGTEFLRLVDAFRPTLILLDLHLPDTDGVEMLRLLAARGCKANVVLMSGSDDRVRATAHELGMSRGLAMCGTLAKPIPENELATKLAAVLHQDPEVDVADLRRGLDAGEF